MKVSIRGLALLAVLPAILVVCGGTATAASFTLSELGPPYVPPSDGRASVVAGDFNHDGRVDIAFDSSTGLIPPLQNCPTQGCVSVLLGRGDATFSGPVNYPADGRPYFGTGSLSQGDINGDGNDDLVVANFPGGGGCASGCVAILYGNGDGTFQAPVDITAGVGSVEAVVVGDFNGDGRLDIAAANNDDTVSILLNQGEDAEGHATFTSAAGSPFPLAGGAIGPINGMTVADLTRNGDIDLVLSIAASSAAGVCGVSSCVEVLTNVGGGTGTFNPAVAYPVDGNGQVAAVALGGDGAGHATGARADDPVDDVLVPGGRGFQVLRNQGNGTLGPPSAPFTYPGAEEPQGLVAADFDNDGKPDVAVADFSSSITALFKGNGDGTFTYDSTVSDPALLQSTDDALVAADFTGDCKPDLAVSSDNGLIVMRNDTPPSGSVCPHPPPAPPATTTVPPPAPPGSSTPTTTSTISGKPQHRVRLTRVIPRIEVTGLASARCTTAAVRVSVTIRLSARAAGGRRVVDRSHRVRVTTVIRLDGERIQTRTQRRFVLIVPLSRLAVGGHVFTITAISHGTDVRVTRTARSWRLSRCSPPPMFTG